VIGKNYSRHCIDCDSFTIDELIDQLIFIEKVEEGIQQSDEEKTLTNDDVKKVIEEWSS